MSIFQKSVINKYLKNLDTAALDKAFGSYKTTFTGEKIAIIKTVKEEEYQDGFLRDLFVNVLGYKLNIDSKEHDLVREKKNQTDAKKADGAIIREGKVTAVIELKDTKTKDMGSVTEQAFGYKNSQICCKYVITSNFHKLRFYIDNKVDFEEFDLFELGRDDFELLYLLLNRDSIFNDIPAKLKEETKFHEETVSGKLYSDYSSFKKNLFGDMTKNNPQYDKLTLFKKSQKLIDRYLFILFSEDRGLLPPNSISRMITRFDVLKSEDSYKPLYEICRQYFGYMNTGNHKENIPAYNGGLFLPDEILDSIKIDDGILRDHLWKLSTYDYATEIDVNILGHIFEHSLSEIEEITATIEGVKTDKAKSKRKKDGVYYTPKYITQYIVENTVGTLCREKRRELGIEQIEFDDKYRKANGFLTEKGKILFDKLEAYKNWLITLKIVDPACGSGAFLNQALNFLIAEHKTIDDIIAELTASPLRLFDTDKAILENNLYGVDINDESVEIAKLSLWLHTARKDRKLSDLNNNIKCGNSLINDPKVAGDKAFDWHKEFPDIMQAGGFDVVIGNPPYVRQELLVGEQKNFYSKNYPEVFNGIADLYVYFYGLALKVAKPKGIIAYISSNKWIERKYGFELRHYLKKFQIEIIVNFSELNIFQDASTEPAIIILRNLLSTENIKYSGIKSLAIAQTGEYSFESFIKNKLSEDIWRFANEGTHSVLDKFNKGNTTLNEYTKSGVYRGILTGLNEAFIIDSKTRDSIIKKEPKADTILKQMVEGDDFSAWNLQHSGRYMVATQFDLNVPKEFPSVYEYLKQFESQLEKRQDKGRNYWNLRACDYYDKFALPKLIYYHTAKKHSFYLDTEGYYISANCYFISNADKYLQCVLNSSLFDYVKKYLFPAFGDSESGGRIRLDANKMVNLSVKELDSKDKQPYFEKADKMLDLNKQLQDKKNKFQSRIKSNFAIEKISTKLESFHEHDFKTFVAEIKKQKVSPTLKQQDEWEEYFNSYKKEINDLQAEIKKTDAEIDQMVYKLYGLTEEEVKVVEGSV